MMTLTDRADELQATPHKHLVIALLRANPFSGYTTKNITKREAIDTLLRYEYGQKEVQAFREAEKV